MKKTEINYQFGRMNIIIDYTKDKKDFVDSFFKNNSFKKDNHNWKFSNIKSIEVKGEIYFIGKLVKYLEESNEEVINGDEITYTNVKNRLKGKSNFFLECRTGLIAFALDNGNISAKQFKENFAELCRLSLNIPFTPIEISTIDEKRSVLERVKELQIINKIKVQLRPSNPSPSKDWEKIDAKLQSLHINSYSASYTSESGIDFDSAQDIRSEIAMASDGYGQATIYGQRDGVKKTINTSTRPITETIKQDSENIDQPVYNKIIKIFKSIQERVHRYGKK